MIKKLIQQAEEQRLALNNTCSSALTASGRRISAISMSQARRGR